VSRPMSWTGARIEPRPRWTIWTVKPHTGDRCDVVDEYENRGHAVARLRGLIRASWKAGSEMQYTLRDGRIRG
jgi:hypothetical protein